MRAFILRCLASRMLAGEPEMFSSSKRRICENSNRGSVLVASLGRSGSSMLARAIANSMPDGYLTWKSHSLPLDCFRGKTIFVFADPNKSIESALHIMLDEKEWSQIHFRDMATSDRKWGNRYGDAQTAENNVLTYDAFGYFKHLEEWLCKRTPCEPEEARILAIKYEHLWEEDTLQALRFFLGLPDLTLPAKRERGAFSLRPEEVLWRSLYNVGTDKEPRYQAYDKATKIWLSSPPILYFK